MLPWCLGAGAAGFDKGKWKSPSWGAAVCGGVRTQLAAVASLEHPSSGHWSHLVPPEVAAALAEHGAGLGALGAMATKQKIQQRLWQCGSISQLPQPGLSQPPSPGHGF